MHTTRIRPAKPIHVGFQDGFLVIGSLPPLARIENDEFDESRARVLITSALGGGQAPRALSYVRRAIEKQRAGDDLLAKMCLALSGFNSGSSDPDFEWRLNSAEGLMNSGVAPDAILSALDDGIEKYSPDQPRVPAGNGRESGQWTTGGGGSGDSQTLPQQSSITTSSSAADPTPAGIQIADRSADWAQYLNPVGHADAAERDGTPFNGRDQTSSMPAR